LPVLPNEEPCQRVQLWVCLVRIRVRVRVGVGIRVRVRVRVKLWVCLLHCGRCSLLGAG